MPSLDWRLALGVVLILLGVLLMSVREARSQGLADLFAELERCPPPPPRPPVEFWRGAEVRVRPKSLDDIGVRVEIGWSPSGKAFCSAVSFWHENEHGRSPIGEGGDSSDCIAVSEPPPLAGLGTGLAAVAGLAVCRHRTQKRPAGRS